MKCNKCIHSDVCYKYLDVMDDRYSPSYIEGCVDFKEENSQLNNSSLLGGYYAIVVLYKDTINMDNYKELKSRMVRVSNCFRYMDSHLRIDFIPLSQSARGLKAHEVLIDKDSYDRLNVNDIPILSNIFSPMIVEYSQHIEPLRACFKLTPKLNDLINQMK